jgi:hypothetical protein
MGLWYWRYLEKPSQILLWSLILGLLQSGLTLFMISDKQSSPEWVENLYVFIETIVMFLFYYSTNKIKRFKQFLWFSYSTMLISFFVFFLFQPTLNFFPSLQSIIFNITSLYFFNILLKENTNQSLTTQPLFWINLGFLLNGIILVLRIYSGALVEESFKYYEQLYIFFCLVGITVYVLFTIGFLKSKKYKST